MKLLTLLSIYTFCFGIVGFAQDRRITKTGAINFEASIPSFEEVKAKNETVTCIFDAKTGEIASLALIKGFRFKIALMEEHFNENYMESDRYPKATFKGSLEDFNLNLLGTSPKEFKLKGKLELHGKTKEIVTTARLKKIGNDIEIVSDFNVNSDDFNITIPKVVSKKVSKIVTIKMDFLVKSYN